MLEKTRSSIGSTPRPSLDTQILRLLAEDSPVSIRCLCSLLWPALCWEDMRDAQAMQVRLACHRLVALGLIYALSDDSFSTTRLRQMVVRA